MTEPRVNFKCPNCSHNKLIQVRQNIDARDVIGGFIVLESGKDGRKNTLLTNETYYTEGTVTNFQCECCGYVLRTKGTMPGKKQGEPIKSIQHLINWLKRHNMLD